MSSDCQPRRLRGRIARFAASLAALGSLALCATASASAEVSFAKAWGWGVLDGASQLETCTSTCEGGASGGGAGQLYRPRGVAVDGSGDVFVADYNNDRIDEFSSAGALIKAWGWGVADGRSQLETCTTTCQAGIAGSGAGQLYSAEGVAVDAAGDVFVTDFYDSRVDEFSSSGAFIRAWGWGVLDDQERLETCTTTCEFGISGSGAGQLYGPIGVAVDGSGDVFVSDCGCGYLLGNHRIDEFSSSGAFIRAWGWGVLDGQEQLDACTSTCGPGIGGGGAGQLNNPDGVAVDGSGDVFVTDVYNSQVDEFSSAGAFIEAWGWGVLDGASRFETCASTCAGGIVSGGSGGLYAPTGVAVDGSGDVFVGDSFNNRVDEFGPAPATGSPGGEGSPPGGGSSPASGGSSPPGGGSPALTSVLASKTALPRLSAAAVFQLPSAKQCVSRRHFTIHVRTYPGVRWIGAVIKIDHKRVRSIGQSHISAYVSLVGLPKGTFVLSITATASDGRKVTGTRTYRTCVPKSKRHYGPGKL